MIRLSDVRYALRLWRRHPAMITVAGLSLGLGVGATTTMYGVVNRVANYQLGFAEPDRLAVLWTGDTEKGIREQPPSWEIVHAILEHGQSFESFGLFQGNGAPVTLSTTTQATRVSQMPVDVNALSIVGLKPALGRTYRLEDFNDSVKQKEARSIVISYETWQERLGGAADVIGQSIHVDGESRSIIGVMPKGFSLVPWEDKIAFWIANDLRKIPQARWMIAVGRLKPGVSLASAQAEATVITRQMMEARGERTGGPTGALQGIARSGLKSAHERYTETVFALLRSQPGAPPRSPAGLLFQSETGA